MCSKPRKDVWRERDREEGELRRTEGGIFAVKQAFEVMTKS